MNGRHNRAPMRENALMSTQIDELTTHWHAMRITYAELESSSSARAHLGDAIYALSRSIATLRQSVRAS